MRSRAVTLSRRLTLEQPARSPDGAGGYSKGWAPVGTLWAEVLPGRPTDRALPAATRATLPLRITVRAAAPGSASRPRAGQRFREGPRVFPIEAVAESDPLGRFLLCHAYEEGAS